jgi:hypothetical protein
VLTATGTAAINGEANLTFDGSTLQIAQQGTFNTTTPGPAFYALHFSGQSTADYATGLTWNGGTSVAQAGIYVQGSGVYGTRMYLATTDAFVSGSKTAITINETGIVTINRNYLQSNSSLRAPIFYDSDNTAYFTDPGNTSVLARIKIQTTIPEIEFADTDQGESRYVHCNGGSLGFLGNTGSWILRTTNTFVETYGTGQANSDFRAPIFYDSNDTTYFVNPNGTSNLVGLTVANTITGSITGNAGTATTSTYVSSPDGDRNPSTKLPNGNPPRSVQYDFAGASYITGATGNYAGVMTYRPWDGTSASTGDSSYQLAFCNFSGVNASGLPGLALRNGINSGWNSTWYQLLHSGNYSGYSSFSGAVYGTIFYDANDTTYYLDPASTGTSINVRGVIQNPSIWINDGDEVNNYNENIRLFNASNGVSVIAFGATGTGGIPTSSLLGFSDRLETRVGASGTVVQRLYNNYAYALGSYRAPVFYDSDDTNYYGDFNGVSRLNGLAVGPSYYTHTYPGIIQSGSTSYNYNFYNGSWSSSVTVGYLANCADEWEFAIHDSGSRLVSAFFFQGAGTNKILMGRDLGWGTTYIEASASFRAPIFYDSNNTAYYFDGSATGDSIRVAGDVVAYYSDERLKDRKGNIENALEKILSLDGFYYEANELAQSFGYEKKLEVGLSAQQVEAVLPEIIRAAPVSKEYKTLNYGRLMPLVVEAFKEQQKEIEELKQLVNKLINK